MTQDIRTIRIATQGPAGPAGLYPHASWDGGQVPYARSSVLAHNGGVWLALRGTSVEPSVDVPDDWASWLDFSGMIDGFATLDDSGKIPVAQLPAIAITDSYAVASQAEMLALTAEPGDIAIRSDLNKSFVLAADDPSVLANWKELLTPTDAVLSVAGRTGAITLASADISDASANGRSLIAAANYAAMKTLLTIAAGDVSGLNALATLGVGAGLTSSGGNLSANVTSVAGRTGAITLVSADISDASANGRSLITAANYAAMKTLLTIAAGDVSGLNALATLGVGAGLTSSGGNLSANVTSVAGRTGAITLASADISDASANGRSLITAANYAAMKTLLTLAQADISGLATSDDVTHKSLTLTGATIVANAPLLAGTQTWNSSGVTFSADQINITDSASAAASLLWDRQVGGASKGKLDKTGKLTIAGNLIAAGGQIQSNSGLYLTDGAGAGALYARQSAATLQTRATLAIGGSFSSEAQGVQLNREGNYELSLRQGANAHKYNVFATYTDATHWEKLSLDAGQTTANVHRLMAEKGSAGGTLRPIAIDGYSKAGAMVAADIPAGSFAVFKDSSGGAVTLGYNDGGTLKTVALT